MSKNSKDFVSAIDGIGLFSERVIRGTLLDMTSKIIKRSPVDTGRFRGNWNASFNSPDMSAGGAPDKAGSSSLGQAKSVIDSTDFGGVFYLTNNLPYSVRLENGYSKQAPAGMLRLTVAEFQQSIDRAIANAGSSM